MSSGKWRMCIKKEETIAYARIAWNFDVYAATLNNVMLSNFLWNTQRLIHILYFLRQGGILAIAALCTLPGGQCTGSTPGRKNLFRTLRSLCEAIYEEGRITKVHGKSQTIVLEAIAKLIWLYWAPNISTYVINLGSYHIHQIVLVSINKILYGYVMWTFIGRAWTSHLQLLRKHCGRV